MKIIRGSRIKGFKFRRQHPIAHFIVDFYCNEAKLVIELDGDVHEIDFVRKYDKTRQTILKKLGVTVLRFDNEIIFSDPGRVLDIIEKHLVKPT